MSGFTSFSTEYTEHISMHYRRSTESGGLYFFTVVTHERRPFLIQPHAIAGLRHAFRHVRTRHPFAIEAIVVLPDHLHTIWRLPDQDADYSTRWSLIKAAFSREFGKQYLDGSMRRISRRERAVWQGRFWEHRIRDEADLLAHYDYIHFNPVKHGYVRSPAEWKHSSFKRLVERGWYASDWGSNEEPAQPAVAVRE